MLIVTLFIMAEDKTTQMSIDRWLDKLLESSRVTDLCVITSAYKWVKHMREGELSGKCKSSEKGNWLKMESWRNNFCTGEGEPVKKIEKEWSEICGWRVEGEPEEYYIIEVEWVIRHKLYFFFCTSHLYCWVRIFCSQIIIIAIIHFSTNHLYFYRTAEFPNQ